MAPIQVQVDISIVTYNSAKWLEKFFISLIAQDYPTKLINIYIQDNCSSDNTIEICHNLAQQYSTKFLKFAINQGKNLGFGYGHNQNLKRASSQFFLVTNVDLEFEKDAIANVINTALNDAENVASWEFRQKPFEHPKYYNPITLETNWSSSACILFQKSALDIIGGYEEKIFMYGEDVELSYRLRDHGYALKYCPRAVCWHYTYESANELKPLQFFGSTLANVYIRLRYGTFRNIIRGYLMYFALFSIPIGVDNRIKNLWKNFLILCKNTPYFLTTRKKNKGNFPIRNWDYEMRRDGAFYQYEKSSHENQPLVSIIVRTYQSRLEWLKQAVNSILNQTYKHIELIVVEDGSNSAESFIKNIQNKNLLSAVKYMPIKKTGRCVAGNQGLAIAAGEYLCFLDDDDAFFPEHIEILVNALISNDKYVAAYSTAFEIQTLVTNHEPLTYKEIKYDTIYKQPFSRALLWRQNYIPIQSILFKRELYEKRGGFDLELEYLEDWNLWTRYSLEGEFHYIEKTTSIYRVPSIPQKSLERQQKFDNAYQLAITKQKELFIPQPFTIADVMGYLTIINKMENLITLKRSTLKNILKKIPFLKSSYYTIRRLNSKIRQNRAA